MQWTKKKKKLMAWSAGIVTGLLSALFITQNLILITWLSTDSMHPTLLCSPKPQNADWVLVDCISPYFSPPTRNSLVFFKQYDELLGQDVQVIKRVAGLPEETIEIRRGALIVNGQKTTDIPQEIQKNYVNGGAFGMRKKLRIQSERYMVLGDKSEVSLDSRYYGALKKEDIQGYVVARIWPLSRFDLF